MAASNRIMCICKDEPTTSFLREALIVEGGFAVTFQANGNEAIEGLKENSFGVVIIKFGADALRDAELIRGIKKIDPDAVIIALVEDARAMQEISRGGVYDFIAKPLKTERLIFSIRKGIELHSIMITNRKLLQGLQEENGSLQKQNILLAKRIEESTKNLSRLYEDLRSTYMRTIKVLAQTIDARDHYTHSHSENVARYAVMIAEEMRLSVKDIEMIREACELHDLGKIGIQDQILSKPSELTPQEWEMMKQHPIMAAKILEPLTFLNGVIDLVRQHHEHYDGSGYTEGRKGEDILLGARIIHLADAYDAMRSARSYRKVPFSKEQAIDEIKKRTGTQFDPRVVEAFLRVVDKIES